MNVLGRPLIFIFLLSLATALPATFVEAQDSSAADTFRSDQRTHVITGATAGRAVPNSHQVREGDTLWDITGHYYGDPYQWPRVWSYNPEITNPHWIYPNADVRLRPAGSPAAPVRNRLSRNRHERGTVWLREQGFIDRDALENAGVIIGAPGERMLLAASDPLYVRFNEANAAEPGTEYTVFRPLDPEEHPGDHSGVLIRIYGTIILNDYDREGDIGRALITESLDPIERGYRVAPVPRAFRVVPPRENHMDLQAEVVAALRDRHLIGAQQVVFINVGENAGLRLGNRFFAVRRGDEWRSTADELWGWRSDDVGATYPDAEAPGEYPVEIVAEGRVVSLRPDSATLLVTRARRAIATGETLEMRAGF